MIVTTTPGIEGRNVSDYLGVVVAQGVLGVNVFKDVAAGMRNIFGGRSQSYENELASGVSDSLMELEKQAQQLGADAVIAVDIDYESVGQQMLMVSASGTAVTARLTFAAGAIRSGSSASEHTAAARAAPPGSGTNSKLVGTRENAAIIAHPTCRARRASTCCGRSIPKTNTSAPPTPRTDIARKIRWRVSANDVNTRTPRRKDRLATKRATHHQPVEGFRGPSPRPLRHRTPSAPTNRRAAPSG